MQAIALVTDAYGGRGGIALYNRNFLKALCAYPGMNKVVAVPRGITYDLEAIPQNLSYVTTAIGSKLKYLKECFRLSLYKQKADLIVCGHIHLLPFAYLLKLRHRCPILLLTYGVEAWSPTNHWLANKLCRKLNAFISIRKLTAKRFKEWAGIEQAEFYYLPNCIDESQYGLEDKRVDLLNKYDLKNKQVVMTVGRLDKGEIDRGKGFDEVIELLPGLRQEIPNLMYIIVGDGEDKIRLQDKVKNLDVDDIVVFAGYISDEDKADYYRLADVLAMPGSNPLFDRYPFRFVFLEALACGVPVVGCQLQDESETNDLSAQKMIIQVNPNDEEDIKRGILQALNITKSLKTGIDKFYYSSFEKNVYKIIDKVTK